MSGIQTFQDTFETRKQSFISAFSICKTAALNQFFFKFHRNLNN